MITFTVYGIPAPQGSKRYLGRGIMIESSKKVKPWREAVKWAFIEFNGFDTHYTGPVQVDITFRLPRPKHAPKKRIYPDGRPDVDKLLRSTLDALKEVGCYEDDSKVIQVSGRKEYCIAPETPGATIRIEAVI